MANKPKFDEDEELDLKPGQKAPKGSAAGPAGTKRATLENEEDLDCDWGDTELMKKKDPMPRVRPEKGKAVRFAILPFIKPKKGFNHYIDKKGTYRCLSTEDSEGICCTSGLAGNANLAIVALVVKYTNCDPKTGKYGLDRDGRKIVDTEWELGHVSLSRTNYTAINRMMEDEDGATGTPETVYDFDIIMTHNEATGIGYTLTRASRTPRYRKDPEMVKAIEAEATEKGLLDGKLLTGRLGRKINAIEWKALLSGLTGANDDDASDNSDL
jgi:hypothetical protein